MKEENESCMTVVHQQLMSVEEYLKFEETSELRHEYSNGQLIEMPGEQRINSAITNFLTAYLATVFYRQGYTICSNVVKITIPGENRFYYPDWFITKEPLTAQSRYVQYQPELIAEVLSKTSRTRDMVDKYLDYIKIPSLKYYLIIDPERTHITVHSKGENGEWESEVYSERTDVIPLPLLDVALPVNVVYR